MDIASHIKLEMTWEPVFQGWRLMMRSPDIYTPAPVAYGWCTEDEQPPVEPNPCKQLLAAQAHVIFINSAELFIGGPESFARLIQKMDYQIFNAVPNDSLANVVRKFCLQTYQNDTRFRHHCDYSYKPDCEPDFDGTVMNGSQLKYEMPGLEQVIKHPLMDVNTTVERCIVSLNDRFNWSREKIADWLETLDVDLTFKVKEDV